MSRPSSPRGEHTPRPGAHWDTALIRTETLVPDCPASLDGQCIAHDRCDTDAGECVEDVNPEPPRPDRAVRRAARRKNP